MHLTNVNQQCIEPKHGSNFVTLKNLQTIILQNKSGYYLDSNTDTILVQLILKCYIANTVHVYFKWNEF